MAKTTTVKKWSEVTSNTPQYTVTDSEGNEIEKVGTLSDEVKSAKDSGQQIYRTSDGQLTTTSNYDSSHIDFNNGKITIYAPKSLLEDSDWVKSNFTENETFKSLAANYKADPTGTTEVTVTNSDGTTSQKTLNDIMQEYADAFNEYTNQYKVIKSIKDSVAKNSVSGLKLTDTDAIIANNALNKTDDKNSTSSVMYIPKSWDNYFDFSKLDSWDANTRTISAKDWYTAYALDGDNVMGEDTVSSIQDQAIKDMSEYLTNEFSDDEKTDAATETARVISAYNTLYNSGTETIKDMPNSNFFTDVRIFAETAGSSMCKNLGDALAGVATIEAGAIDSVVRVTGAAAIVATGLMSDLVDGGWDENTGTDILNFVQQADTNYNDVSLVKQFTDSYNANVTEPYESFTERITKVSSAATAGMIVGNLAAEFVKQIVVTDQIGKAAAAVVDGTATVAQAAAFADGAATIIQYGSTAQIMSLLNLSTSIEFSGAAAGAAFTANILAQGVSDTILNDYEAIGKVFQSEGADELGQAYLENVGWNLAGELTGLATSKGWNAFVTKTEAGKTLQAALQRGSAKVSVVKRKVLDKVADIVKSKTEKPTGVADWWQAAYKESAEFSEQISSAAKTAESTGATTVEATEKAVINKMEFENWVDQVVTGQQSIWKSVVEDPDLVGSIKAYQNAATSVIKLEESAGIDAAGKWFTQETSNYTVWLQRLKEYELKGNLSAAEKTMQTAYAAKVLEYEASHSQELVNAVKNFVSSNQSYNKAFTEWELKQGLITKEEYEGWISSGRYGENGEFFQHTARLADNKNNIETARALVNDYATAGNYKAKLAVDDYSLKPGDIDADYLDPQLVNYAQQSAAAKVIQGREGAEIMMNNGEVWEEITADGKPVVKSELKKLKNETLHIANETINKFTTSGDILNYDLSSTAKEFTGLNNKQTKTVRKINKLLGLDSAGLKKAAFELDDAQIKALAEEFEIEVPENIVPKTGEMIQDITKGTESVEPTEISDTATKINVKKTPAYHRKIEVTINNNQALRQLISENKDILGSDAYKTMVADTREKTLTALQTTRLNKYYERYADIIAKQGLVAKGADEFTAAVKGMTDDLVKTATDTFEDNAFAKQLLDTYELAGASRDVAKNYLVLSSFVTQMDNNASALNKMLNKNLSQMSVSGNLTTATKKNYSDAIKNSFKDTIKSEWADSVNAMKELGVGAELIDMDQYYNAVYKEMEGFIENIVKQPTVISVLDRSGNYHLYNVSPTTATLYKTRPNMYEIKNGAWVRVFNRTNRLFRIGTTGLSIKSFTNQWVRDPLNAYIMGGMAHAIKTNQKEMAELFGEQIVASMEKEMSSAGWDAYAKGLSNEELATKAVKQLTEGEVANIYGGVGGETAYYRQYQQGYSEQMFGNIPTGDEKAWKKAANKMDEWMTKFEDSKFNLGNTRELYLRKSVYTSSLNTALSAGHTLKDAQTIAEFTMRQATTNFSRAFSWGNKITSSVPYLGAAINGSASFWRLLELDPLGISGRFIGGLIIPTMALTAQSLSNESDKEIYMSVPEYIKEDNLVFVVNGQLYKIPIPQELSAFVAPFRQVVEKANGASNNSWLELISSDLLSISPIDLSGFVDLDQQTLASDENFWSTAVGREAETLISQLSPQIVKSAYMLITGRDPYTGKEIDTSYKYFDDDGNLVTMDYTDNIIAQWFSERLQALGINVSPAVASEVLSNFFGTVGDDFATALTSLFNGDVSGAVENTIGTAASAFSVSTYNDEADRAWKEAVSILETKKATLLSADGDLNKISTQMQKLDQSDSNYETKLANLRKQRYAIVQEYQDQVLAAVKGLESKYGGDYDSRKFAATINLMTFSTSYTSGNTQAVIDASQEVYYNARNEALQTMADLGFNSPNDLSIFGYMAKQADGSVKLKTYSPTAILNVSEAAWGAGDVYQADISAIISNAGIKKSDMWDGYYAAKAQGKSALKSYKSEWNAKVVKALYSYIQDKGVDNVVGDTKTRELLDDYIFIDNLYNTKNYLKEIFE